MNIYDLQMESITGEKISFSQTMNIYDLQMESITGEKISFSDFKDQALLIVNLASQ